MSELFHRLELNGEVTHQFGLPNDLHTLGDLLSSVVNVLQSDSDHIHVVVGVHTTRNSQTEQVETAETVLTRYRVTVGEDVTDLAATDTGLEVELYGQGLEASTKMA